MIEEVKAQQRVDFELIPDGVLLKQDRIYVPRDVEVKQAILEEAHSSAYAMHPRYQDVQNVKKILLVARYEK